MPDPAEPAPTLSNKLKLAYLALFVLAVGIHFHDSSVFSRQLHDHDDIVYIDPIKNMGWSDYWRWFSDPNTYAFPLRDFTFWLDFQLSDFLEFKTFWITNFLIALFAFWMIVKIIRRTLPFDEWIKFLVLATIAVHPFTAEMVQWTTLRKHLCVAAILGFGTYQVIDWHFKQKEIEKKNIGLLFGLWIAAFLCFPTGSLWIFWALWFLHPLLKKNFSKTVLTGLWGTAGLLFLGTMKLLSKAENFSGLPKLFTWQGFSDAVSYGVLGVGRGFYNLLFPYRLAPYYEIKNPLNWIGFGMFLLFTGAVIYLGLRYARSARSTRSARGPRGTETRISLLSDTQQRVMVGFGLLAIIYFAPSAQIFLTYPYFAWADRYLVPPMPYFVTALLLLMYGLYGKRLASIAPGRLWAAFAIIPVLASLNWDETPLWKNGAVLMAKCVDREDSAKCYELAISKNLDYQVVFDGCETARRLIDKGKWTLVNDPSRVSPDTVPELPLFDSFCIATRTGASLEDKLRDLDKIREVYGHHFATSFGRILVYLQEHDLEKAYQVALETTLNEKQPIPAMSSATTFMKGQVVALCELLEGQKDCQAQLEKSFKGNGGLFLINAARFDWAKGVTLGNYRLSFTRKKN